MPAVPVLKTGYTFQTKPAGFNTTLAGQPHSPAPVQLMLEVAGNNVSKEQLDDVNRLIEQKNGVNDVVINDMVAAQNIYDKLRQVHPSVRKILKQLFIYVDDKETVSFDSWTKAAHAAYKEGTRLQKKVSRNHPQSPPSSPYNSGHLDYIDHLNNQGRQDEHMKPGAKYNELKVIGQMGEYSYKQSLMQSNIELHDSNVLFGYNSPGIDILTNSLKPFRQSKLHLGTTEPAVEMLPKYLVHIENSKNYAQTFLKHYLSESTRGKKYRNSLKKVNEQWQNTTLTELDRYGDNSDWRIEGKDTSVLDLDHNNLPIGPLKLVSEAMAFSTPSDIYNLIPNDQKVWFHQLPYNLDHYRKVKSGMEYRFQKGDKTDKEEHEEGEFIPGTDPSKKNKPKHNSTKKSGKTSNNDSGKKQTSKRKRDSDDKEKKKKKHRKNKD